MTDLCAYCRRDITQEIPNDWNTSLCFKCAQKEHFLERKISAGKGQKTLWDSIK